MELETTVVELAPGLLRYCRGRLGCPSLAEEVAQDSLRVLVERWRDGRPPDNPAAFVFTVARRRAARAGLRQRLLRPLDSLLDRAAPDPDPAALAMERQRLGEVTKALASMPAHDREIVLLVAAAELRVEDAARVLGLSRSAAKMRLSRARRRLSQRLEAQHEPA